MSAGRFFVLFLFFLGLNYPLQAIAGTSKNFRLCINVVRNLVRLDSSGLQNSTFLYQVEKKNGEKFFH